MNKEKTKTQQQHKVQPKISIEEESWRRIKGHAAFSGMMLENLLGSILTAWEKTVTRERFGNAFDEPEKGKGKK